MFKIGKNFHVIHMTDDLQGLDSWYDDVFSVHRFMTPSYMVAEKRDASLVLIGDLCIEPLAPSFHVEGWDSMPLGRFYNRFNNRWHSIAWYVQDMGDLYRTLKKAGIRMYGTGGVVQTGDEPAGAVFTHPRDTYTQLEFVPQRTKRTERVAPAQYAGMLGLADPRFLPGFNPAWWSDVHPLGAVRSSHVTLSAYDMAKARDLYVNVFGGELLYESEMPLAGTNSAFVAVGEDLVVELATPADKSSPLAADMEKNHEGLYAVTFKVNDLDAAARYLESKGITGQLRDESTLVADPATTHGVVMGFTTWDIPNDRRSDWSVYPGR
jgi:catechol 2,3-dioxygenase-like lactoylglutathione lyase family enzyme